MLRAEVLQCHVPTEQDEWMQFETRALKEFTRIFPPEKKAIDKAFTEECEVEFRLKRLVSRYSDFGYLQCSENGQSCLILE